MTKIKVFSLIIAVVVLSLWFGNQGICQSSQPQAVCDKMVRILKQSQMMEFEFKRMVESTHTGACDSSSGNVKMQGDKFSRVTIDDRIIVTNNDTTFDYSGSHNQLTISMSGENQIQELFISGSLENYRVIAQNPSIVGVRFQLASTDERNEYQNVVLEAITNQQVSFYMPKSLSYTDGLERRIAWEFGPINFKPNFPPGTFEFKIPEGCRIVNLFE